MSSNYEAPFISGQLQMYTIILYGFVLTIVPFYIVTILFFHKLFLDVFIVRVSIMVNLRQEVTVMGPYVTCWMVVNTPQRAALMPMLVKQATLLLRGASGRHQQTRYSTVIIVRDTWQNTNKKIRNYYFNQIVFPSVFIIFSWCKIRI